MASWLLASLRGPAAAGVRLVTSMLSFSGYAGRVCPHPPRGTDPRRTRSTVRSTAGRSRDYGRGCGRTRSLLAGIVPALRSTHLTALNASFDHIVGYIKANASADDDETSTVDPVTISKRDGKKRARK